MAKQATPGRVGTKPPRSGARFGGVTSASSKGMPLTGPVKGGGLAAPNHRIGNRVMNKSTDMVAGYWTNTGDGTANKPRSGARYGATSSKNPSVKPRIGNRR